MNWQQMLDQLIPIVGEKALRQIQNLLTEAEDDQEGWKKTMLGLVADAVEQHGAQGIAVAQKAIADLMAGKAPVVDWANPRTASDVVALMQSAEAGQKTAYHDFGVKVSQTLGTLLSGLLKGLISTL